MAKRDKKNKKRLTENAVAMSQRVDQQATEAALVAATEAAVEMSGRAKRAGELASRGVTAAEALYKKAQSHQSRVHVGGVDLAGGLAGVLSFEGLNWVVRRLGKWAPSIGKNVDYWQSLPHLILGIAIYWGELLTRKTDASGTKIFPSMPREIASEWAKAFTLLGANNLARAIRVRRGETKEELAELEALRAENKALNERVAKLEGKKE